MQPLFPNIYKKLTWQNLLHLGLFTTWISPPPISPPTPTSLRKNLIIDTDIFSDVDDVSALLLTTSPLSCPLTTLIAITINTPSSYSALAASGILAYYNHSTVPIGLRRPITNTTFFDDWTYELGEYASKVAFHWAGAGSNASLRWGEAAGAEWPVRLYRRVLAAQEDNSTVIASIGFLENLSALLNSTADDLSPLTGRALIAAKVTELVIMGGSYPSGHEYNFWGDNPASAAHVVNTWDGRIVFSGAEMGGSVVSGAALSVFGPEDDPVRAAYNWYAGYNTSRPSWDPLTALYACRGLGEMFEYVGEGGYNYVWPHNGSNAWVFEKREGKGEQFWLRLRKRDDKVGRELDELFLRAAWAAKGVL